VPTTSEPSGGGNAAARFHQRNCWLSRRLAARGACAATRAVAADRRAHDSEGSVLFVSLDRLAPFRVLMLVMASGNKCRVPVWPLVIMELVSFSGGAAVRNTLANSDP
jgi:hypothetical protein